MFEQDSAQTLCATAMTHEFLLFDLFGSQASKLFDKQLYFLTFCVCVCVFRCVIKGLGIYESFFYQALF